jgi:hypothetical protein
MSLPSVNILLRACKVAIDEDRPIYLDYWTDSLEKKCCIGVQGQSKFLVKSDNEYTSAIQQVFKCETAYIVLTENSLYIVDASIPIKRIAPTEEK